MKKILITGCAGFIGFHVTNNLLDKKKFKIFGVDSLNNYYDKRLKKDRLNILLKKKLIFIKGDLSKINFVKKLFKVKFDVVINLAAQAGVRHSIKKPHDYVKNNIVSFLNIIENIKKNKKCHLVYASTSSVYGLNKKKTFYEEYHCNTPLQFYAVTKKTNELTAYAYGKLYGLRTSGLRFFTVYGPWGRPDMALFKFTESILNKKKIDIYNHGNHKRDFTYIDDIVDGIIKIALSNINTLKNKLPKKIIEENNFQIYNIARGRSVNLMDFVREIEINLKKKAKKKYLPLQAGDVEETHSSIRKIRHYFDYSPKTSVKKGVKNFVDWYLDYYAK